MAKTGSTRLMMQAALTPRKTVPKVSSPEGTFEYIEAKIRCDAEGTTFGGGRIGRSGGGRMRESTSSRARERENCGPFKPKPIIPIEQSLNERSIHSYPNRTVRISPIDCSWQRRMTLGPRLAERFTAKRSRSVWCCVVTS